MVSTKQHFSNIKHGGSIRVRPNFFPQTFGPPCSLFNVHICSNCYWSKKDNWNNKYFRSKISWSLSFTAAYLESSLPSVGAFLRMDSNVDCEQIISSAPGDKWGILIVKNDYSSKDRFSKGNLYTNCKVLKNFQAM